MEKDISTVSANVNSKPIERSSSFTKNVLSSGLSKGLQIIFNFVILGIVIKTVGIENWGTLTYSLSIVALLSILQMSISAAAAKRLSDYYYKFEYTEFNKYFSATLLTTIIICSFLIISFLIILLYQITNSVNNSPSYIYVFILTCTNSILQILTLPFVSNLQSINRIDIVSKIAIIANFTRTLLVFTLFLYFKTIETYCFILTFECMVTLLSSIYFSSKHNKILKINFKGISKSYVVSILYFNLYNLLNNLSYILFIQLPVVILSKRYGTDVIGYYGLGIQINSLVRQAISVIIIPLTSMNNILNSKNDFKSLFELYTFFKLTFMILSFSILINTPLIVTLMGRFTKIDTIYIQFISNFILFVSLSIIFLPSSLLVVTFEKIRITAFVGISCALLASLCIYFNPTNNVAIIPLILGAFYFTYDLIRKFIVEVELKKYNKNFYFSSDLLWFLVIIVSAFSVDNFTNSDIVISTIIKNTILLIFILSKINILKNLFFTKIIGILS